jgi:hypothetical protein
VRCRGSEESVLGGPSIGQKGQRSAQPGVAKRETRLNMPIRHDEELIDDLAVDCWAQFK